MSANITNLLTTNKDQNYQKSKKVTLIGTLANALLTIFKFIAGIIGGSQAMIADAIHSLSDFGSDVVVLIGLKIAQKPSDKNHPYGHGRAETFSTLLVGIALLFLGFNILREAITHIISGDLTSPGKIALAAAFISIITKEFMYQITMKVAKDVNSTALKANAWHHRTDALSSIAALVGIGGAMLREEWQILDPIAAVVVSVLVVKVGLDIVREAVSDFMETAIDEDTVNEIEKIVRQTPNVLDVHSVKSRKVGSEIFVDLHIEVNPQMTVTEGHDTARNVRKNITSRLDNITDVLVHVEPEGHRTKEEQRYLEQICVDKIISIAQQVDGAKNIHDVIVHDNGECKSAELHVEIDPKINVSTAHKIAKTIEKDILQKTEIQRIIVHVDPLGEEDSGLFQPTT